MTETQNLTLAGNELDMVPPLMQAGFQVEVEAGCSVRRLLSTQWGIPDAFIESRISTVFLNGKPVDDLDAATVHAGATLALSGAMPGLVGATMRRGGIVSGFRSGITHSEAAPVGPRGRSLIRVKLFNVLIPELMHRFLSRGILVETDRLPSPLRQRLTGAPRPERIRLTADAGV